MNYFQALRYLDSFRNLEQAPSYDYGKTCRLERFSKLCDVIGRPQDNFKSVLISGTKGKGSVCAILHSILFESGYKTGLYTSPHILDLRERIKVNKRAITKREFSNLIGKIKESIKYVRTEDIPIYKNLTYFEILTAVCFLYFSKKKVDFAVIEVGLGGRLDATNITCPLVSAITAISYEHTHLLGKSLAKIAEEKAGIIKENSFTISAPQKKKVVDVIKTISRKRANKSFIVGKDIRYKCSRVNFYETVFDYQGIYQDYKNLELSLIGRHQAQNGSVSLAVIEILKRHFHFPVDRASIDRGFRKVNWSGRFDILRKRPCIIADGAHNKDSAEALRQTLLDLFGKRQLDCLVLGISSDKDIKGIGSVLCPLAKNVIFTGAYSPRAAAPGLLSSLLSKYCANSYIAKTPEHVLLTAKRLTPDNGIILITGSLFLVGEVMEKLGQIRKIKLGQIPNF